MATTETGAPASPTISAPRDPYKRRKTTRGNYELYSWVFMRASGVLLLVLVFGHLFVNLMTGDGVHQIDFAFVAGKWASPFWKTWDLLMLWLAMIHGTNGVRTVVNDYASRDGVRITLKVLLYVAAVVTIALGTLVIFTFDPCISGGDTDLLPAFCFAS
ncbi:succinate dehydrogenase, hydrophobic membrane anchor protein [Luteimicrobium subarcticum]|uniref:Succinate dehydrogenase hydrophobic membrane anchor subunit n=1 Tax=Luteimicrobium subarcticum TaxID=620910 RepID=A0A2M8WUM1_9MICO|nr:succinate dehydrogenase, hydrophobic membrane anchor protein [Luteimicrobium subarcticum]PJI94599.1 succinate dehydrogenase subunit D [Luteimicrobium subarcticum]